jgi:HAD superfamily hydrolase (TIGR01509 family)
MSLEAIFFDVGSTLVFPNLDVTLAPLLERGVRPEQAQLFAAERRAKREMDALMMQSGRVDQQYWETYYRCVLEDLEMDDGPLPALVSAARTSSNWTRVLPGTRATIESLGQRYKLGVISNSDGRVATLLENCGLGGCFLKITDSGTVGHEKPDARIFQAALNSLGVVAEKSVYIGDIYSIDYLGARNAGLHAVLMDVCGAYANTESPRVESLEALENRLQQLAVASR